MSVRRPGVLVEGWSIGWDGKWLQNGDVFNFTRSYLDFDLEAVTDCGRVKGVRLIGHHETSGSVTNCKKQMTDAYDLDQKHGVMQIKTGYVVDGGDIKYIAQPDGSHRDSAVHADAVWPDGFHSGIFDLGFNGLDGENRPQTTLARQLAL